MRRKLLLLVAVAMVFSITGYIKVANAAHPNVIFILTDDQRWDQLGCAGHPYLKTPHIDRLAAEGVQFSNMFITTSLCSPSRASYLSGLYASSHGVVNNFTDYPAISTVSRNDCRMLDMKPLTSGNGTWGKRTTPDVRVSITG